LRPANPRTSSKNRRRRKEETKCPAEDRAVAEETSEDAAVPVEAVAEAAEEDSTTRRPAVEARTSVILRLRVPREVILI
jgi:hypothetical protein